MPESRFVAANGINIRYLDWRGTGPALVCIHGITSQGHVWDEVAEELSPQYRVLAPDLRGHGDSDKPASGNSSDDYAADLEGFAQALGLERFTLMGHSLGGRIALHYAGLHPRRVERLILEDPALLLNVPPSQSGGRIYEREKARPEVFATLEEAIDYVGSETDQGAPAPYRDMLSPEALRARTLAMMRQRADSTWEWKYSHAPSWTPSTSTGAPARRR